jgi:hypothetical protein
MSNSTNRSPQFHRELSSRELDLITGGVKAVEMQSPVPQVQLKYTFSDVMVES